METIFARKRCSKLLNLLSPSEAKRLRYFLEEVGYSEENLRDKLGLKDLPSRRLRNFARLHDQTSDPSPINTLLRWFWLATPQEACAAEKNLPTWFIPLALECGLLRLEGKSLSSEAMLFPVGSFIIAADHTGKIDSADSDLVLWPNPTSRLLARFTVRRHSRATLDLGTGNGIQALAAAAHSDKVVATDLNRRAAAFAMFNARLNGIENVEFRVGNAFEPVAGLKFDLIVSNPPFFVTPSSQFLFCDNPLDLDQLCRQVVREAPFYLNEDGYFQMLCEWAEIHGQPWQERLFEWLDNTGCDAWVMRGYAQDPAEYAEERIRSTTSDPARDAELYANYVAYYHERKVRAIHGGVIAMHRRSGHNWILIEEVDHTPKAQFGESVLQTFAARDFLQAHTSDDQLLDVRPALSVDARLEQVFRRTEGGWNRESLTLRLVKGFGYFLGLQPIVAEFLSSCDGTRTLRELIANFATKTNAPLEQVQQECLVVVRKLIERGFLLC